MRGPGAWISASLVEVFQLLRGGAGEGDTAAAWAVLWGHQATAGRCLARRARRVSRSSSRGVQSSAEGNPFPAMSSSTAASRSAFAPVPAAYARTASAAAGSSCSRTCSTGAGRSVIDASHAPNGVPDHAIAALQAAGPVRRKRGAGLLGGHTGTVPQALVPRKRCGGRHWMRRSTATGAGSSTAIGRILSETAAPQCVKGPASQQLMARSLCGAFMQAQPCSHSSARIANSSPSRIRNARKNWRKRCWLMRLRTACPNAMPTSAGTMPAVDQPS